MDSARHNFLFAKPSVYDVRLATIVDIFFRC
jgi:hypothetical protein